MLELPERVNKKQLPEMEIVNMCKEVYDGNNGVFSRRLISELTDCMARGEQVIIFINRPRILFLYDVPSLRIRCQMRQCDVSLVYHKRGKRT